MTLECLPQQKETTRKYCKISRIDQARIVAAVQGGQTQESAAEQNNVPRTTLEHWVKRTKELKCQYDPEVTTFLESPAGIAFLHRLLIAALRRCDPFGPEEELQELTLCDIPNPRRTCD